MKETIFTQIQENDLTTALDIYNHYISTSTVTFDPGPVTMDTFKNRIFLNHELYVSYMIRRKGVMVGFCFLCPFKKHEAYNRTAELGIYLKPEHTSKGIGTKAVEHLV